MMFRSTFSLMSLWSLLTLAGLLCFSVYVRGLIRDFHYGDPEIAVDLHVPSGWISESFRVWGEGTYSLSLSTVIQHRRDAGRTFSGSFEVRILDPDNGEFFRRIFSSPSLSHTTKDNHVWTTLEQFQLNDMPLHSWELQTRILQPDEQFKGTSSSIFLRKQQYDPGMGGILNYLMIVPAFLFSLASLVPAQKLQRLHAIRWPMYLSIVLLSLIIFPLLV